MTALLCYLPLALSVAPQFPSLARDRSEPRAHRELGEQPSREGSRVVFLAFDGVTLTMGGQDDARADVSGICGGSFAPYGEGPRREAALQMVRADWADFDVSLVTERPASGDYTMSVVTPTNCLGGAGGVAFVNCGDTNPNNVTFAFVGENDQWPVEFHASAISQEIAHAYGLDHTDGAGDLMNPAPNGSDQSFVDACLPITGGSECPEQHAAECGGDPNQQNSYRELLTMLGGAVPDVSAPEVRIVQPSAGAVLPADTDVVIVVEADDDTGVAEVRVSVDGGASLSDSEAPYAWTLPLDVGSHSVEAVALDLDGNESRDQVEFEVGGSAASTTSDGEPVEDTENDESEAEGEEGAPFDPAGAGFEQPDAVAGCGCRVPGSGAGTVASFLGAVLALVSFRRRRPSHCARSRHRTRTRMFPVACFLACTLAGTAWAAFDAHACAANGPRAATPTRKADLEWQERLVAGELMHVSTVVGDVTVTRAKGSRARVRGYKSGRDAASVRIRVEARDGQVWIGVEHPDREIVDARVDFAIELPDGVALRADTVRGGIDVDARAERLELTSVEGRISARGSPVVEAKTVRGRVSVELPRKGSIAVLEAVQGAVEIRLPAALGAQIRASSETGEIHSDFSLRRENRMVGAEASATRGNGRASVRLRTVSGSIAIARAPDPRRSTKAGSRSSPS